MSDENDAPEPSLEPQEMTETIEGEVIIVREASEAASIDYRNRIRKAAKFVNGKPTASEGLDETVSYLVHRCCWETDKDKDTGNARIRKTRDGKPVNVTQEKVLAWTHRRIEWLFEKIQKMSNLDTKATIKSLEVQRDALQARIDELRKAEAGEGDEPKNETPESGMTSSDFAGK
jgi:hypothetical protein